MSTQAQYEPHFILKTSIMIDDIPSEYQKCVFATGCFWGAEKGFWRMPGVYTTAVGYSGGHSVDPTYKETCTGTTGHTESVLVAWDPEKLTFVDIVRQFLQCHDPTQVNGQGEDNGTQYRGALFYDNEDQHRIGMAAIAAYEKTIGTSIATEVKPLGIFYYAEQYHQQYLARPGNRQYCSARPLGIQMPPYETWVPQELQAKYKPKLPESFWEEHAPSPHCVLRLPNQQIIWSKQ